MIKCCLSTVFLGLAVLSTTVLAKDYTVGEAISGISSFLGKLSGSGDSSSAASNASAGALVKDLPDLPNLSDKPFVRGVSKLDYAEIPVSNLLNMKNYQLTGNNARGEFAIFKLSHEYNTMSMAKNLQKDVKTKKVFDRENGSTSFSNPSTSFDGLFDLSKVDEITRSNPLKMYTFTFTTHFRIPDEFVNKKGQVVLVSQQTPVYFVTTRGGRFVSDGSEVCYQTINNEFMKDNKGTYNVKKGNFLDYAITCYFGGELPNSSNVSNSLQSMSFYQQYLPKNFKVYNVPDPLAKDAGQSYTLTNRDMFLYENEVYPAK